MESTFSYSVKASKNAKLINGLYLTKNELETSDISAVLEYLKSTVIHYFNKSGEYPVANYASLFDGNTNKAREMAYFLSMLEVDGKRIFSLVQKMNSTNIMQNFNIEEGAEITIGEDAILPEEEEKKEEGTVIENTPAVEDEKKEDAAEGDDKKEEAAEGDDKKEDEGSLEDKYAAMDDAELGAALKKAKKNKNKVEEAAIEAEQEKRASA